MIGTIFIFLIVLPLAGHGMSVCSAFFDMAIDIFHFKQYNKFKIVIITSLNRL